MTACTLMLRRRADERQLCTACAVLPFLFLQCAGLIDSCPASSDAPDYALMQNRPGAVVRGRAKPRACADMNTDRLALVRGLPCILMLRGGGDGMAEEGLSGGSIEECEPDWLVDMKAKQAYGEDPSLEDKSSWERPDNFQLTHAGIDGKDAMNVDKFRKHHKDARYDLPDSPGQLSSDDGALADGREQPSTADDDEAELAEKEDVAYIEHHGARVPLVGNAGTDVEFLRRLTQAWKSEGHSMKVVVPDRLRGDLNNPVRAP